MKLIQVGIGSWGSTEYIKTQVMVHFSQGDFKAGVL